MQIYLSSRLQSIIIDDIENALNGEYRLSDSQLPGSNVPKLIIYLMDQYLSEDEYGRTMTPISQYNHTSWFTGLILADLYYKISPRQLEIKSDEIIDELHSKYMRRSKLAGYLEESRVYVISAALLTILSYDILESGDDFNTTDEILSLVRKDASKRALSISDKMNSILRESMSLSGCDLRSNKSIITPEIIIDSKDEWGIPESAGVVIDNDGTENVVIDNHSLTEKDTKYRDIRFRDLKDLHDGNVLVWMSLLMPKSKEEKDSTIKSMTEFFREHNLIGPKDEIVNICEIKGNVRESTGDHRVDQLIVFNEGCKINPGARLMLGSEIKWVSDFVVNSSRDYA
jgi:hypothetical protein